MSKLFSVFPLTLPYEIIFESVELIFENILFFLYLTFFSTYNILVMLLAR